MIRPAFLESRHPLYAAVFVLTVATLAVLLAMGFAEAWRLFRHPPPIKIDPIVLGNRWMMENDEQAAIREFEQAVAVEPHNFEALSKLGTLHGRMGELEDQLEYYKRALKYRPRNAILLNNAGIANYRLGRREAARKLYEAALVADPKYFQPHANLGALAIDEKDLDGAIAHFRRALELEPHSADTHNSLGAAFAMKGDLRSAIESFSRAVEIRPDYKAGRDNLARAQRQLEHQIRQAPKEG